MVQLNETGSFVETRMDTVSCPTDWSKSEKQTSYTNAYRWDLEKWYRRPYWQSRNADTENKCMVPEGDRGGREGWGWHTHTMDAMTSTPSCVWLFAAPWTVARQASWSMGFPRWEDWSGLPFPPPGNLPNPGIKLASPALAGGFFTTVPPGNPKQLHSSKT